jgi:hypothetical protein
MKGNYRLISEILLFSVGIIITTYVVLSFGSLKDSAKEISLEDQMRNVADAVSSAIIKIYNSDNATVRLSIPDKISDTSYRISVKDVDGGKIIVDALDGSLIVERQLFNINYDNTDSNNNIVNNSEIVSSAQFIEIIKNEKITLARVVFGG